MVRALLTGTGRLDIVLLQARHGCGEYQRARSVIGRLQCLTPTGTGVSPMTTATACTCTVVVITTHGLTILVQTHTAQFANWTYSRYEFPKMWLLGTLMRIEWEPDFLTQFDRDKFDYWFNQAPT